MSELLGREGILPLDKPAGPTSHDMVALARKAFGLRRIGHTGTLDPFASGLLLLCLGRATRLAEYFGGFAKEYVACARLGVRTTTDDPEGEVVAQTRLGPELSPELVSATLQTFQGEIDQVPPIFSAKKIKGSSAYELARRGDKLVLPPVRVTVHEVVPESVDLPFVRFRVRCSSGTYIRAIARDLGERLGVGGHLTELRRVAIGPFRVEAALSHDQLGDTEAVRAAWISPIRGLAHLPRLAVGADEAAAVESGRFLPAPGEAEMEEGAPHLEEGKELTVTLGDRLVAVAVREGGRIRPRKVFPLD